MREYGIRWFASAQWLDKARFPKYGFTKFLAALSIALLWTSHAHGAVVAANEAEEVVLRYFRALQNGDVNGLASMAAPGFIRAMVLSRSG